MKINEEINRLVARWSATTTDLLREVIDRVCAKRGAPRWSVYRFDGRNTTPDDPNALVYFHPLHLSSMRHFRVCHTNEAIWEIMMSAGGKYDPNLVETTVGRFRKLDLEKTRAADVAYVTEGTYIGGPEDLDHTTLAFGWRTHAGPPGYFINASCSDPRPNPATRYAFITAAIQHMALKDMIQVLGDEKDFVLKPREGWSIYELDKDWPVRSPHYFPIGPFPSFDDVWRRAENFRASPLGARIDRLWLSFTTAPDVYETMYERLNELANDWIVQLSGSYADGIDPHTADASQSPDGRFPVVLWSPDGATPYLFYQADIIPTPEGRFLEVHSNCSDIKKLLKEAESATGVPFTPV